MIISQKKSEFEIQGQLASKQIGIAKGKEGKILGLLSDLYKNRFAFCVELISNAWDSHIEAQCTDTPIEMNLEQKNTGNYVISFIDRGVGIDAERAEVMFSYGDSTKEEDEDSLGHFGLGAKSPLAYHLRQFDVSSVKDGVYRKWLVSKDAMNKPVSNLLLEVEAPDNPNRTVVSVILDKEDVEGRWSKEIDLSKPIFNFIREKTLYFDNLVYTGELESLNNVKIVTYNNKYKIRDDVSSGELGFLLGQVYYRIDYKELEIDRVDIPCVFTVPLTAHVEPTLTREDVHYTEHTKKYLIDRINEFKKWIQSYINTKTHLKTYDEYLTKDRYDSIKLERCELVYRPNYSYPEKKLLEENFPEFSNYNEFNIIECFLKWEYDIRGGKKFSTKRKWNRLDFDRYLLKTDRASTVTDKYLKQQGNYQVFSKRTKKDIIYQLSRNLIKFRHYSKNTNRFFYRNNNYRISTLIKAVARVVGMKINRYEHIVIPTATRQAILNPVRTRYVKGDDEVTTYLCRKHSNYYNYAPVFDKYTETIEQLKKEKTTTYYSTDKDTVSKGWMFNNNILKRCNFVRISKKDVKKIESLKNFKKVEELIAPVKWNKNFNKIVTNMLLKQFRSKYSFFFNQTGFIRKFSSTLADELLELDNLYDKIDRDKISRSNFNDNYMFKEFMLQTIKLAKDNNHINLELWTKMETVKKQLDKLHVLTVFDLNDDNSVYYASNYIRKINKDFKLNTEHYQEEKINTIVDAMTELFKPQPILNLNSIL